jgi:opacity protein-like surface antigen
MKPLFAGLLAVAALTIAAAPALAQPPQDRPYTQAPMDHPQGPMDQGGHDDHHMGNQSDHGGYQRHDDQAGYGDQGRHDWRHHHHRQCVYRHHHRVCYVR